MIETKPERIPAPPVEEFPTWRQDMDNLDADERTAGSANRPARLVECVLRDARESHGRNLSHPEGAMSQDGDTHRTIRRSGERIARLAAMPDADFEKELTIEIGLLREARRKLLSPVVAPTRAREVRMVVEIDVSALSEEQYLEFEDEIFDTAQRFRPAVTVAHVDRIRKS